MAGTQTVECLEDVGMKRGCRNGLMGQQANEHKTSKIEENICIFETKENSPDGKGKEKCDVNGKYSSRLDLSEYGITKIKFSITKSQWTVNIAFFLAWTSISGLTIIQSGAIGLVGTVGLSLNFAFSIIGATIVAPMSIRFLGCKWTMMLGLSSVVVFVMSNFYPHWGTIVPASVLSGLGMGPMFAAQGTYLTQQGVRYARLTGEGDEAVVSWFFGLFFCVFLSSVSIGCLLTSAVSSSGVHAVNDPLSANASLVNVTLAPPVDEMTRVEHCGANFCPWTYEEQLRPLYSENATYRNGTDPFEGHSGMDDMTRYILVAIYTAITIAAVFVVFFFLDDLPRRNGSSESQTSEKPGQGSDRSSWQEVKESVMVTIRQCQKTKQLLMMPSNIYIGMMQSFSLADLTEGFIGCALGVEKAGYALMTYGFVAAGVSLLTGLLLNKTGRLPLYTFAHLLRLGVTITLLVWVPDTTQLTVFFLLPAMWAMSDSMLITLTNSFYGITFADSTDGAFSAYRLFEAIGFVIGFAYSQLICVEPKTYILLAVHIIGAILYYITEIINKFESTALEKRAEWKQSMKYILSFLRPNNVPQTRFSIQKCTWTVNIAFFLCWTSMAGLMIIQSSVIGMVGTVGLSLNFAASILGATVAAPLFIRLIGCKKSIILGLLSVTFWELSNLYPHWGTIIPTSLITGVALGPMFAGQGSYLTHQGVNYAQLTGEDVEAVVGRFFGIFFAVFLSSVSVGCLVTSAVLSAGAAEVPVDVALNWTKGPLEYCGANYCPWTWEEQTRAMYPDYNDTQIQQVMDEAGSGVDNITRYKLTGILTSLTVLAGILVISFMDELPKKRATENNEDNQDISAWNEAKQSVLVTLKQCKRLRQLLMMPLNIYIGMMQSYSLADLTEGFIGCALGVENTGFALVTYGVVASASSALTGVLVKSTGRIPLFTFANVLRLATTILLLLWTPDTTQLAMFFVLPALWAVADSMLIALTNSFYGIMFMDNTDGAFSAYRLFEAVGYVIGYVYNKFICVDVKTYLLLVIHVAGATLYYVTEYLNKKQEKNKPKIVE